ncbi:cytochrome c6 c6C [Circoviridae sp.]|nr:cytochrome c6 c6C [Circoviridae sp.]UOF81917.1 cytochrome c6 c6C [Circoviridae sp.]
MLPHCNLYMREQPPQWVHTPNGHPANKWLLPEPKHKMLVNHPKNTGFLLSTTLVPMIKGACGSCHTTTLFLVWKLALLVPLISKAT